MCSPSRATLFTGLYPAEHGVDADADRRPTCGRTRATLPDVVRTMADLLRDRRGAARPGAAAVRARRSSASTRAPGTRPCSRPRRRTSPACCAARGYEVAYKGKWHLTHPSGRKGTGCSAAGCQATPSARARVRLRRLGGPGRGRERRRPRTSAAATPARARAGTRSTRARSSAGSAATTCRSRSAWSSRSSTRTTCSATRPPTRTAATRREEFRDLGVELPPTVDEDLRGKPGVHALMRMGMTAYLGALRDRRMQLDYVNFYAYLHRVIDEKIGRLLARARRPRRPGSLRSRTVSSAAPTTARWASRTAACARRRSTPTRRRSTSRSSSPTRSCSRAAPRPTRSPR